MCRLRRAQQPRNHSLSEGIFSEPPAEWESKRVGDRSPRASLQQLREKGFNVYAEINRRNAEFWAKKKEQQ
jgi:hypothetical protein